MCTLGIWVLAPSDYSTSQHQIEIDDEVEILNLAHFLTVVLIVGSNEDHIWSVENRRPRRQYLGRASLLPNPRIRS